MDPLATTAAAQTIAPAATPPPAPPAPVDEAPPPVEAKGRAFDHALFQGNGNKTGILKRMSTEEIETVQDELGVRARETADGIVAARAEEVPDDPTRVEIPLTEPVQTVPVKAANVEPQTVGIAPPEAPTIPFEVPSFTTDDPSGVTAFVLSAGITASGED